jgi:hypothetical protein
MNTLIVVKNFNVLENTFFCFRMELVVALYFLTVLDRHCCSYAGIAARPVLLRFARIRMGRKA